jgi:paired amphipathic helix protein Sin3a
LAIFLKSLDHQGLNVKAADKKNLSAKHLVDVIKTKTEEQRRQKNTSAGKQQKIAFQFVYDISDMDVVLNVLRIMVVYVKGATQHNAPERRRIRDFFEQFVSIFFGISYDQIVEATNDVDRDTPEDDSEELPPTELPNGRGKRSNGKKADLRRGVLDRNRNGTKARDASATGSKESTPESAADDDDHADNAEDQSVSQVSDERWLKRTSIARPDTELDSDQAVARDSYKLWANQNIFVFFSIFQTLYRRFKDVKESEAEAVDLAERASLDKPAKSLDYINTRDEPRLDPV